ncbi:MAG: ATP-binding cassette domain-containing protein, partial [Nocardioidaceae bacterium]
MPTIEIADVTVEAPGARDGDGRAITILGPVSVTLSEQRIALIGANGSGKSTLARLLNGLVSPATGSVRVAGLDTERDGAAVRRTVGFVFTDPESQLVMPTVAEDVALSLRRGSLRKG